MISWSPAVLEGQFIAGEHSRGAMISDQGVKDLIAAFKAAVARAEQLHDELEAQVARSQGSMPQGMFDLIDAHLPEAGLVPTAKPRRRERKNGAPK